MLRPLSFLTRRWEIRSLEVDSPVLDLGAPWPEAAGEGAMITALRPLTAIIALLTGVADGFVDGVIIPTTPHGAGSTSVSPLSPVKACGTKSSGPGVFFACRMILFILSGIFPKPVSETASLPSRSALAKACLLTFAMISFRFSKEISKNLR